MAEGNVKLVLECSPEHLSMGTARMKKDKETEEECKKNRVNIWKEVQRAQEKVQTAKLKLGLTVQSKLWMNYLTNLMFTINPSTAIWGDKPN